MKKRLWPLMFVVLCGAPTLALSQTPRAVVTIDHMTKIQNPIGRIGLGKNDWMNVDITRTDPTCFDYNGGPKPPEPAKKALGATGETVTFHVLHDGETTDYLFE